VNFRRTQGKWFLLERWVRAAIQEAEKKFRCVPGYRNIEEFTKALEGIEAEDEAATKRVA
jgi:hypothetical protein